MAVFTLTLPDAQLPRLVAAVAQQRGVDIASMNNAQKVAMMKADLVVYWKNLVQAAEIPAVQAAAAAARMTEIEANIQVT